MTALPADSGQARRDVVKERAYLFTVTIMAVLFVVRSVSSGFGVPYWSYAYPALVMFCIAIFAGIRLRKLTSRQIEALFLAVHVGVLFGFLVAWRFVPAVQAAGGTNVGRVMLWAGMAFPLCFLAFGTRRGIYVSVFIYAAFLTLVVPPAVAGELPDSVTGNAFDFTASLTVFFAVLIALLAVLASRLEDAGEARAQAGLFARQATTDVLTGLANRRRLDDELARQFAASARHHLPLSVVLIDIDHFKDVNDRYGHDVGDVALTEVARRLHATSRYSDLVGRWGGEEFLIVAGDTDLEDAIALAERCRRTIADDPAAGVGHVTASFGVATAAADDDPRMLVRRVDNALYTAKRDGRNRVVA